MVPSRETIITMIPPPSGAEVLISRVQTAEEIVACVRDAGEKSAWYCKRYAYLFSDSGNIPDTCEDIWEFMKQNFRFNPEPSSLQTGRSVRYIIYDPIQYSAVLHCNGERLGNKYFDCKHFSTFSYATCKALGIKCELRLAAYDAKDTVPTHVYCVAFDKSGNEIIIDGTLDAFGVESKSLVKYKVEEF